MWGYVVNRVGCRGAACFEAPNAKGVLSEEAQAVALPAMVIKAGSEGGATGELWACRHRGESDPLCEPRWAVAFGCLCSCISRVSPIKQKPTE